MKRTLAAMALGLMAASGARAQADLPDTVDAIRPSVVAVGTYQTTRRPPSVFRGTGFVVGDGQLVATNNHVVPDSLDEANRERLVIFAGRGRAMDMRSVTVVARDPEHDLALLRIAGGALKPMRLGGEGTVREGRSVAFTGFPVGMVLGLHPVTHRGIVAAVTPPSPSPASGARTSARRRSRRCATPTTSTSSTRPPIRAAAAARCTTRAPARCSA